jgi:succinate-semialdehyde dehydrogenase/glutarate-semialdehyde dehydrogenase
LAPVDVAAAVAARHLSGRGFEVIDPSTGLCIGSVTGMGSTEAREAVTSAAAAASEWRARSARDRAEVLRAIFELMVAERDDIAAVIAAENGKSLQDALGEVTYAAEFFRWFGEEVARERGVYAAAPAGGYRFLVTKQPVGVVAMVTPWNFPAAMITRKVAPALAAGCTAVVKPAAETPLTALMLVDLFERAGLPKGTVSVVTTTVPEHVVSTWLDDPRVRALSFTGSTVVGKHLLRQAADRVLVTAMELGGCAPFIVCDDADVDAAVEGALVAKLRGGGQACTAANTFFVHEAVAEEFTSKLSARFEQLSVGPAATGAQIGPLISEKAVATLTAKVDAAVEAGAVVRAQAPVEGSEGYFFAPLVVSDVPRHCDLASTELFGPVAPVVTWNDQSELIGWANESLFGLAGYVYSSDLRRAVDIAEALEVGMVGINRGLVSDPAAPFGGMKESGLGREGAREGIEEFQETQMLAIDWPKTNYPVS